MILLLAVLVYLVYPVLGIVYMISVLLGGV